MGGWRGGNELWVGGEGAMSCGWVERGNELWVGGEGQ